jgi:hypothetical protein
VGKPLPLLELIDVGDRFRAGDWVLVLYRSGCPDCQSLISAYPSWLPATAGRAPPRAVAFVEVPPYGALPAFESSASAAPILGRLRDDREWFADTPIVLALRQGAVVERMSVAGQPSGVKRSNAGNDETL